MAKGALGHVGLWMAPSLNRAVPKEVTAFQARARGSQRPGSYLLSLDAPLGSLTCLLGGGGLFCPVLLGVGPLELLGTEPTHVLRGDIRPQEEGLSHAATVDILECRPEVILSVVH